MPGSRILIAMAAGSLFICGCGGPPGAGTVKMTAIKAAAARRGIPESKARAARPGPDQPPRPARSRTPARPIPRARH